MIPPHISPHTQSPGEVEVFRRLRDDPQTQGWIALHSLDVANHNTQLFGEIDFLVVIPSQGVLCLEVKGCRSLRREDGLWFYGVNPKPDARGPFKQASDAMHSVRTYLAERNDRTRDFVYWSAVLFPYVDVEIESNEWHSWQLIDRTQFENQPISSLLEGVLEGAHKFLSRAPNAYWYKPARAQLTVAESKLIASLLRPHFEFYESPQSRARRQAAELKQYTEDQFGALDAMEANERVIFMGPAGTGKTLLAIEAARRASARGQSVLLLCYNRLLGSWLQEQTKGLPLVKTSTLHKHMLEVAGIGVPDKAGESFWAWQLPELAIDKLLVSINDETFTYDLLVIDEAQDLITEPYLDFLDLSLNGGLDQGQWLMFGDFEQQMIYGTSANIVYTLLAGRLGLAARYFLRTNCRNTPRIAETVRLLGQMEPGYKKVLRADNYAEPKIHSYSTNNQRRKKLAKSLQELLDDGFSPADIVILTAHGGDTEVPDLLGSEWKHQLIPLTKAHPRPPQQLDRVRHGTIHYFKGMEAPAIIVAGIDEVTTEMGASLLYIALSRALHKLIILAHDDLLHEMRNRLVQHTTGDVYDEA